MWTISRITWMLQLLLATEKKKEKINETTFWTSLSLDQITPIFSYKKG